MPVSDSVSARVPEGLVSVSEACVSLLSDDLQAGANGQKDSAGERCVDGFLVR